MNQNEAFNQWWYQTDIEPPEGFDDSARFAFEAGWKAAQEAARVNHERYLREGFDICAQEARFEDPECEHMARDILEKRAAELAK